jgi:hypothetical protein
VLARYYGRELGEVRLGAMIEDLISPDYVAELSKLRARAEPRRLVVVAARPACGTRVHTRLD